ncbi:uncharacterized protein c16h19orf85 [Halichoeres trimaculatus]|uniref:uncharacterized protein c16h19orf85 n=1 Tax=Halichoeres trimaculatus TaxID=147232 RepID=UPI003D9E5CAA
MRPSISLTLEPGLDRGVPCGRDLYTFVTSAAGHMMRTLQKPRKNRPSKRQVNHRRFLHNMIQRKFADIEAANHRLASALSNNEKETNVLSLPSQKSETLNQSVFPSEDTNFQDQDKCSHPSGRDGMNTSRTAVSVQSHETETRERKQPEVGHLWKRHPKSQHNMRSSRKTNQSKERQMTESQNHKLVDFTFLASASGMDSCLRSEQVNQPGSAHFSQEGSPTAHQDTTFFPFGQNVDISSSFSPQLSPLSLDSCDFSMQVFKDVLTQKNAADITESQWTDFIDLFSAGSKDLGGCMDVEAYLESICARQSEDGQEGRVDDVGFSDQSDSYTKICNDRLEVEDMHTNSRGYRYEYGYICCGNQGLSVNYMGQNKETQFNNCKLPSDTYSTHNLLSTAISYLNPSELQTYQNLNQESSCMLINRENNQNLTPFEGVAQSFSVPLHTPEDRPIPTPPHEDDWLFTDILKDRKSPDCQENVSPFKSDAWIDSSLEIRGES